VQWHRLSVAIEASTLQQAPINSFPLETRFFSSKAPRRNKEAKRPVTMNEHLIKTLMKRYDVSAGEVYVRLIVDEGPSNPSSIEVVSLLKAMETARDLDVDLIGINLEQDPPVVKAQEYTKLAYRTLSKKQKSSSKATKEFTLRAGIAKNDLDRKVMNVIDYLKKGHNCQLSISSSAFNMRMDPGGIMVMIQNVTDQVGDVGVCEKGVQFNEERTQASFLLRPNRKRNES
jgi:translation initiation factor IF-3